MPSRITQIGKAVPVETPATGGDARVTQITRVSPVDVASAALGGDTRITQIARVVIGTIDLGSGNAPMLRGMI